MEGRHIKYIVVEGIVAAQDGVTIGENTHPISMHESFIDAVVAANQAWTDEKPLSLLPFDPSITHDEFMAQANRETCNHCDMDYELQDGTKGHQGWCPNK